MARCILTGVDGSAQAEKAFRFALDLARWSGAELHVCAAVYGAEIELAEASEREALTEGVRRRMQAHLEQMERLAGDEDLSLATHLLEGHPVEELLKLAGRISADHIVVGHRSKGMFERLLMGSVAKRVVDFARCTVTVVR
ncbi:MAG: universal stress protein [Wenzhouxiangella sp.]|nr:MAG: universal stress protein [Wenzhouxiangella sp.]